MDRDKLRSEARACLIRQHEWTNVRAAEMLVLLDLLDATEEARDAAVAAQAEGDA